MDTLITLDDGRRCMSCFRPNPTVYTQWSRELVWCHTCTDNDGLQRGTLDRGAVSAEQFYEMARRYMQQMLAESFETRRAIWSVQRELANEKQDER